MYRWLLAKIDAPWWIKFLLVACLVALVVLLCFQWVFPWAQETFELVENTVN